MKYINRFSNDAEYQVFKGGDYVTPNVNYIEGIGIKMKPIKRLPTFELYDIRYLKELYGIYEFEEGMTWREWINSEYNTIGVVYNRYNEISIENYVIGGSTDYIYPDDLINKNEEYLILNERLEDIM